jgi:putative membrane protein
MAPISESALPLMEKLALYRTRLANERTLLSYLRSGLALLLAGVTMIQFAQSAWFGLVGSACIPGSIFIMIYGTARFHYTKCRINEAAGLVCGE